MNTNTKSDFERIHDPARFNLWDEWKLHIIHNEHVTMCMLGEKPHRIIMERPKYWVGPRFCRAIYHESAEDCAWEIEADKANPFRSL